MDTGTAALAKHLPKKWNIGEFRANIGAGAFPALIGLILSLFITIPHESGAPDQLSTHTLVSSMETQGFTS
jgi:hypothetical protein